MRVVCLAFACLTLLAGQTVHLQPVTKAPGDKVKLEIQAKSQPKRAPVTLSWDVVFPAQLVEMDGQGEAGSAATKAGKSLKCTARNSYTYNCALSGGQKPIEDGTIAIFHFKVRPAARAGSTALRIEHAVSTTADSRAFSLKDTEAVVVIRR